VSRRSGALVSLAAILFAACSSGIPPSGTGATASSTAPPPPTGPPASPAPAATPLDLPTSVPLVAAPTGPIESALVLRVVDGDTIVVDRGQGPERVRYIGMDTPETVHPDRPVEWMGREASAANRAMVEGREVVLERDVSETDRFGRLLRYVWVRDGDVWQLVNLALVAAGFAQVVTYPPDVKYVDAYLAAQTAARDEGRGLWGDAPGTTESPVGTTESPVGTSMPPGTCDSSYPTVCIAPPPPDLDCADIPHRRFAVLPPDPHRFDGDRNGIGCES
jgi:micrococcal nuclease